jgi:two-component system, NarL family, nitrate/nitrite response regulator NarL
MQMKIDLILVDDHIMVREGLKSIIKNVKSFNILGDFSNGKEVINFLLNTPKENHPKIIVTDLTMPEMSGLELTKEIKKNFKHIQVLVLSMHNEEEYIKQLIDAGADGYLLKESEKEELIKAIENIATDKKYFNHEVSNILISNMMTNNKKAKEVKNYDLSEREKEVLTLIVEGLSNKLIAPKLFISSRTVDAHRYKIMQKLNVKNTAEMVRIAISEKLV